MHSATSQVQFGCVKLLYQFHRLITRRVVVDIFRQKSQQIGDYAIRARASQTSLHKRTFFQTELCE